jgi:hypothetical protein
VVTASPSLLGHQAAASASVGHAVFVLRDLTHRTVFPAPAAGARFRLAAGTDLAEFTVDRHGTEVERSLRFAIP